MNFEFIVTCTVLCLSHQGLLEGLLHLAKEDSVLLRRGQQLTQDGEDPHLHELGLAVGAALLLPPDQVQDAQHCRRLQRRVVVQHVGLELLQYVLVVDDELLRGVAVRDGGQQTQRLLLHLGIGE